MTSIEQAKDRVNAPMTPFEAGIKLAELNRQETDIDLVPALRNILTGAGISEEAVAGCYDQDRYVQAAKDRIPQVQRTHLNRFLEKAIYSVKMKNTIGLRNKLLPNCTTEHWLNVAEKDVAPFLKENNALE